ncbi:SpoIVB peptidase [Tissierella creatinophila]|uniref:SpoIVB peptidase n=1 Tax=Tissierella creatinophila DSM 6911 TaxID=1123403 RepID=A0A1U7M9H1_TISCR|nr:SpoIVB peptidase [Tissierella creatinophila]OLS03947.1 SpoIVB peptidase precursor [Tissierella creatinophila DSM 6911]
MDRLDGNKKNIIFPLILFIILMVFLSLNQILFYPSNFKLIKGENKTISASFPFSIEINNNEEIVKPIFNEQTSSLKQSYNLNAVSIGKTNVQLKLLGLIPVKNYDIDVVDRPRLVPGGDAIGVSLNTKGVLVVAITDVIDTDGKRTSPAKDAGIKIGDSIIKINDEKIISSEQVVNILNNETKKVNITISRNNAEFKTTAVPIKALQDNSYRLGIWVRDKTTGIGTLSYYNYDNQSFGALGHGITDVDTGKLLTVENGLIMQAKVAGIQQGKQGKPGEIKGVFYKTDDVLGNIKINNELGIYGNMKKSTKKQIEGKPIPIAFKEEVKEGKAHILTTLDDNKIKKYDIEIVKAESQNKENQKSMIIKITDPVLLNKTGGIVQGMSGSPIIQNNKIVGAVTHVFVNNPKKGYGLYIEWMLKQEDKL